MKLTTAAFLLLSASAGTAFVSPKATFLARNNNVVAQPWASSTLKMVTTEAPPGETFEYVATV
jgi:hypothetical protein